MKIGKSFDSIYNPPGKNYPIACYLGTLAELQIDANIESQCDRILRYDGSEWICYDIMMNDLLTKYENR